MEGRQNEVRRAMLEEREDTLIITGSVDAAVEHKVHRRGFAIGIVGGGPDDVVEGRLEICPEGDGGSGRI